MECVGSTRLLCLLFLREKCLSAREQQLKSYSVCIGVFRQHLEYCWFSILFLCPLSAFLMCVCWVFIDPSHLLYNSLVPGMWDRSLFVTILSNLAGHMYILLTFLILGSPAPLRKFLWFICPPTKRKSQSCEHSLVSVSEDSALGIQLMLWTRKQEVHCDTGSEICWARHDYFSSKCITAPKRIISYWEPWDTLDFPGRNNSG